MDWSSFPCFRALLSGINIRGSISRLNTRMPTGNDTTQRVDKKPTLGCGGGNRPLHSISFWETPCAETLIRHPGAGCCGDWELDTPGYPIKCHTHFL